MFVTYILGTCQIVQKCRDVAQTFRICICCPSVYTRDNHLIVDLSLNHSTSKFLSNTFYEYDTKFICQENFEMLYHEQDISLLGTPIRESNVWALTINGTMGLWITRVWEIYDDQGNIVIDLELTMLKLKSISPKFILIIILSPHLCKKAQLYIKTCVIWIHISWNYCNLWKNYSDNCHLN